MDTMAIDGSLLIRWTARAAGTLVCVLLAAFAIDAIGEGFLSVMMHLLPALVALGLVVLAWRWELVGGAFFIAIAVVYARRATVLEDSFRDLVEPP